MSFLSPIPCTEEPDCISPAVISAQEIGQTLHHLCDQTWQSRLNSSDSFVHPVSSQSDLAEQDCQIHLCSLC